MSCHSSGECTESWEWVRCGCDGSTVEELDQQQAFVNGTPTAAVTAGAAGGATTALPFRCSQCQAGLAGSSNNWDDDDEEEEDGPTLANMVEDGGRTNCRETMGEDPILTCTSTLRRKRESCQFDYYLEHPLLDKLE